MMNNMGMVDNNYYYYNNNNNNNSYNNNNNININNPPPPPPPPGYWSSSSSWDLHHRHEHNHNHNHNNNHHHHHNNNNNQNPRKRPFDFIPHPTPPPPPPPPPHQDCKEDGVGFVKLYVAGIPITCTHLQIRSLFELYGNIVEIIILNDKRTGLQRECCFIKFTTLEEAERAIGALNNQYYFPGATLPIKVRYAEGERERFSQTGNHVLKLYVNGLHKQASKMDIGEIFSTYGIVEDIHIVRDEFNQSRGMGFVQFARRDMAIAAINSLNGIFFMEGCDQPLIVRFAEPKKPRSNYKFGGAAVGSHFQEPPVRPPVPYLNESMVGSMPSNVTGRFSPKTTPSSSQSPRIGGKSDTVSSSSSVSEASDSFDCDWSEHICPDGYKYYYNCVSCESRWEKPQEYSLFEQQLQKEHTCQQQQQCSGSHKQSRSPSAPQINFSELDRVQTPVMSNPLVGPTCC